MVESMRTIRLEESFDEAVLPDDIQSATDFDKIDAALEETKLSPKEKHDQTRKGTESNYREDLKG